MQDIMILSNAGLDEGVKSQLLNKASGEEVKRPDRLAKLMNLPSLAARIQHSGLVGAGGPEAFGGV